jgi:phage shock protein A
MASSEAYSSNGFTSFEWRRCSCLQGKKDQMIARARTAKTSQKVSIVAFLSAQVACGAASSRQLVTHGASDNDWDDGTGDQVNDMLSTMSGTTSMDAFERMKEKVEMLETQAEVSTALHHIPPASLRADVWRSPF